MRVTYDPQADAAFIYLTQVRHGPVTSSTLIDHDTPGGAVIAEFDLDGRLVGIEILGARRLLPPEVISDADVI